MANPEDDHGFVYDVHGRIDVSRSPYFDPYPGWDLTVDGYLNRIRYQLAWAVEDLLPTGRWTIIGRRPPPPPPPSPSLRVSCAAYLGLIAFLVWARWKQEHKAKGEVVLLLKSERKEREQIEASGKSKENEITIEAEHELERLKDDIRRLERQITQLRLTTDSSKMTAFGWGANGSYASRLADVGKSKHAPHSITKVFDIQDQGDEDLQRERECVMCMSEEVSVVFLPCAHQVICSTCNQLHERQGMKDCPSCRTAIQRRISIRRAEFIS
ncbi:hypothetical protein M5K25_005819 [Dendrobium thyrsiflorum]|uniref:RING-type domain-containing protein n=1 Tax=Dendrobium thyrsiflorum TaxID=117978 RepID=A0ABD0VRC1_DENTH